MRSCTSKPSQLVLHVLDKVPDSFADLRSDDEVFLIRQRKQKTVVSLRLRQRVLEELLRVELEAHRYDQYQEPASPIASRLTVFRFQTVPLSIPEMQLVDDGWMQ